MRHIALIAVTASLGVGACLGEQGTVSDETSVVIRVPPLGIPTVSNACYALRVSDSGGGVALSAGTLGARAATAAEAEAQGAICSMDGAGNDAGISVRVLCTAGERYVAALGVAGLFDDGGAATASFVDPCSATACTREFECADGEELDVVFDLTIMRDAEQGFFDIELRAEPPAGLIDVCYAMRVSTGASDGEHVWSDDELCASQYGNGSMHALTAMSGHIALTYIGACDASTSVNEVTVWVRDVRFTHSIPEAERLWQNPCPAPSGEFDPKTATGGCRVVASCHKNADETVDIDIDLRPGHSR